MIDRKGQKIDRSVRGLLISTMILMLSQTAFAQESVNETKQVDPNGYVRINLLRGDLNVEGWDKNEVQVTGRLDEKMERFIFDVQGKETVISVKLPTNQRSWCCDEESDLTIKVPTHSNLVISVVSTDVDANDIQGGIEIGSVSGDMHVSNVTDRVRLTNVSGEIVLKKAKGHIRAKTVSGDIDAFDIDGPATFHSVSGSIVVNKINSELDLESVSGDIEVSNSEVTSVRGHTVSGDVNVNVDLVRGANVEFDSLSGNVRLKVGGSLDARYDIQTSSGDIRNKITNDRPKESKYVRDETLRFVVGEGTGEVVLSSGSGDISISKN